MNKRDTLLESTTKVTDLFVFLSFPACFFFPFVSLCLILSMIKRTFILYINAQVLLLTFTRLVCLHLRRSQCFSACSS